MYIYLSGIWICQQLQTYKELHFYVINCTDIWSGWFTGGCFFACEGTHQTVARWNCNLWARLPADGALVMTARSTYGRRWPPGRRGVCTSLHYDTRSKEVPARPQLQMQWLFVPQHSDRDVVVDNSFQAPLLPAPPTSVVGNKFFLFVYKVMV